MTTSYEFNHKGRKQVSKIGMLYFHINYMEKFCHLFEINVVEMRIHCEVAISNVSLD